MPRAERRGSGFGAGKGYRGGRGGLGTHSFFQKSTFGGTFFAFASMLIGNWLDKKLSQRKERKKSAKEELL